MKRTLLIVNALLLFLSDEISAQNLVPNPGFENYTSCPVSYGELYKCQSWSTFGNSPDYFNSCSPDTLVNVPQNDFGFQYAASGNAYCGFVNVSGGPAPPKEYLGAALAQPLVAGQKYFASLKVSRANFCATDYMGIRLSTVPFDSLNPPPLDVNAVVYSASIINDSAGWTQIKGSFIADSNYTYIIVGNLFTNGASCFAGTYISYYYVDDVCLSIDSLTCYSSTGFDEPNNTATVNLYPNPFSDKLNIHVNNNGHYEIILFDVTSRQLLKTSFENSVSINTSQLAKGIYIYEVRNCDSKYSFPGKKGKIVKE